MNVHRKFYGLLAAFALLTLSACGGDDALSDPDVEVRPESSDQTSDATSDETPDESNSESGTNLETDTDVPDPDQDSEPDLPDCADDPRCIDAFPTLVSDSTTGSARQFDSYDCAPDIDESGPEQIFRIDVAEPGFLAVEIVGEGADADIDVHLLTAQRADACISRGHWRAGEYVDAGTYWVAADSWTDPDGVAYEGSFDLAVNLVRPADFAALGLQDDLATDALNAFVAAWRNGETDRFEYAVTDFSLHSSLRRQWVVDLATGVELFRLHVGHGEASIAGADLGYSTLFSNIPESHQSSLGMIRAAESYVGDYGYSMRLDGLEPGFNDNVRPRDIVVHPWEGNRAEIIARDGWVTPSWGCATLDPVVSREVVDTLRDGAVMLFWYPDPTWRSGSTYLGAPIPL